MQQARVAVCVLCLLCAACGRSPDSPASVVRDFLDAMQRTRDESQAMAQAFELLDQEARTGLTRRAERARSLSGRPYEPFQMIAQGRFAMNFTPAVPRGMREHIDGDHAVVTVVGQSANQRAEVPLVREDGHWRIHLDIPPMHNESATAERAREGP